MPVPLSRTRKRASNVNRSCGQIKNLIEGFYRTRKNRGAVPSSYSYECKECTIKRILKNRKKINPFLDWTYPDW